MRARARAHAETRKPSLPAVKVTIRTRCILTIETRGGLSFIIQVDHHRIIADLQQPSMSQHMSMFIRSARDSREGGRTRKTGFLKRHETPRLLTSPQVEFIGRLASFSLRSLSFVRAFVLSGRSMRNRRVGSRARKRQSGSSRTEPTCPGVKIARYRTVCYPADDINQ